LRKWSSFQHWFGHIITFKLNQYRVCINIHVSWLTTCIRGQIDPIIILWPNQFTSMAWSLYVCLSKSPSNESCCSIYYSAFLYNDAPRPSANGRTQIEYNEIVNQTYTLTNIAFYLYVLKLIKFARLKVLFWCVLVDVHTVFIINKFNLKFFEAWRRRGYPLV